MLSSQLNPWILAWLQNWPNSLALAYMAPVNKLVFLMWLLWGAEKFRILTSHYFSSLPKKAMSRKTGCFPRCSIKAKFSFVSDVPVKLHSYVQCVSPTMDDKGVVFPGFHCHHWNMLDSGTFKGKGTDCERKSLHVRLKKNHSELRYVESINSVLQV